MITIKPDQVVDKRKRLEELKEFHKPTLELMGIQNDFFLVGKMAYIPVGKNEMYVTFFDSEMDRNVDIYLEFTNRDLVPEDSERRLWKMKYNPHYKSELERTPADANGNQRWMLPTAELMLIPKVENKQNNNIAPKDKSKFDLDEPDDIPISEMTLRDFAAIMLKKQISRKKWLNELITKK